MWEWGNSITDVPGVRVGSAEDTEALTGCTTKGEGRREEREKERKKKTSKGEKYAEHGGKEGEEAVKEEGM